MRKLVLTIALVLGLVAAGAAAAAQAPPPASAPTYVPIGGGGYPSGCRDVDVSTSESSFLFNTTIYRFHALEHWCWSGGSITQERHNWSFEGSSTACLDTVYQANAWFLTFWNGIGTSGHYTEERAHVTNCVFHFGDWKEFYPDVKVWVYADGSYSAATSN